MSASPTSAAAGEERAPLEEVMLAMDVVDTLRHREGLVLRELNAEDRRASLIERLRDIYRAQGIEVSDAVLAEGVQALEDDRFRYTPPPDSFQTRLARMYIRRNEWGRPLLALLLFAALAIGSWGLFIKLPELREQAALPNQLDNTFARIVNTADDSAATDRAQALLQQARAAAERGDYPEANGYRLDMEALLTTLEQAYDVRVVSRPNESSGVYRIPAVNPSARNYYLIVEAIDANGDRLRLPITSEEDGRRRTVRTWGVRVDQQTFNSVAADKRDDGIIQGAVIGRKERGELEPEYRVATTGDTITDW